MRNLIVDRFFFFFALLLLCAFSLNFWVNEMVRHVANGYVWCIVEAFHHNNNNSLLLSWTVCVCYGMFLGVYSLCRVFFFFSLLISFFPTKPFRTTCLKWPKKKLYGNDEIHYTFRWENIFLTLNETIQKMYVVWAANAAAAERWMKWKETMQSEKMMFFFFFFFFVHHLNI